MLGSAVVLGAIEDVHLAVLHDRGGIERVGGFPMDGLLPHGAIKDGVGNGLDDGLRVGRPREGPQASKRIGCPPRERIRTDTHSLPGQKREDSHTACAAWR